MKQPHSSYSAYLKDYTKHNYLDVKQIYAVHSTNVPTRVQLTHIMKSVSTVSCN